MHIQFPTSITLLINQWPPIHDTRGVRTSFCSVQFRAIDEPSPPRLMSFYWWVIYAYPPFAKNRGIKKEKEEKKERRGRKKKSKKRRYFSYTILCTSFIAPAFPPPPPPPPPSFVRAPLFSPISRGPKVPPRFIDGETHRRHRRDCARY